MSMDLVFYFVCFFFFKQKTAYEMRISDWSSDVCSSDLAAKTKPPGTAHSPGSQACSNTCWSDWSRRRVRGSRMMADPTRGGRDEQARSAASGAGESRYDARRLVAIEVLVDQEEQRVGLTEAVVGGGAEAGGNRGIDDLPGPRHAVHKAGQLPSQAPALRARGGGDEQARAAASGAGESRYDARRLVAIEVLVDQEEQRVGLTEAVVGGGAEAGGNREIDALPGHRHAVHKAGQLLSQALALRQRGVGHDDGELVAADAGHVVAFPRVAPQNLADGAQDRIAGRVAVGVGDRLEAVEVAHHQQPRFLLPPGTRQRARQLQLDAAAVQQAGRLVGDGERFQIADAGALQGQGLLGLRSRGQQAIQQLQARRIEGLRCRLGMTTQAIRGRADLRQILLPADRKSVVKGKSVSVRVVLGGGRILKKKTKTEL